MFIAVLDNAVKYSGQGEKVLINVSKMGGMIAVSIQDHGCGIRQEELENFFTKFYRAGQKQEKGSGLGLAIVKNIAKRHNIQVGMESVWQEGTKVVFSIPGTISDSYGLES